MPLLISIRIVGHRFFLFCGQRGIFGRWFPWCSLFFDRRSFRPSAKQFYVQFLHIFHRNENKKCVLMCVLEIFSHKPSSTLLRKKSPPARARNPLLRKYWCNFVKNRNIPYFTHFSTPFGVWDLHFVGAGFILTPNCLILKEYLKIYLQ